MATAELFAESFDDKLAAIKLPDAKDFHVTYWYYRGSLVAVKECGSAEPTYMLREWQVVYDPFFSYEPLRDLVKETVFEEGDYSNALEQYQNKVMELDDRFHEWTRDYFNIPCVHPKANEWYMLARNYSNGSYLNYFQVLDDLSALLE